METVLNMETVLCEGVWEQLLCSPGSLAILIAAGLATAGWFWAGWLQRSLLRKQHTFNALLEASFNSQFQGAQTDVRGYIKGDKGFPDLNTKENEGLKSNLVFLLNHYEFLAAGIRNGDISEKLLKDSARGTIVNLFKTSEKFIESTRDSRHRRTTFEHIEWLYKRWDETPPDQIQRIFEWFLGKPFWDQPSSYKKNLFTFLLILIVLAFVVT